MKRSSELARNVVLIQSFDDNIQLCNPAFAIASRYLSFAPVPYPVPQALIRRTLHKVVLILRHILNSFPQVPQHDFFKNNATDRVRRT